VSSVLCVSSKQRGCLIAVTTSRFRVTRFVATRFISLAGHTNAVTTSAPSAITSGCASRRTSYRRYTVDTQTASSLMERPTTSWPLPLQFLLVSDELRLTVYHVLLATHCPVLCTRRIYSSMSCRHVRIRRYCRMMLYSIQRSCRFRPRYGNPRIG
jgi:hypothetical protein